MFRYNISHIKRSVLFILIVQTSLMIFTETAPCQFQNKQILVLNSYHPGYSWSDKIMDGIRSVFPEGDDGVTLHIEYMDTKYLAPERSFPILKELYRIKYRLSNFDVIIASDNNALNFLKEYHMDLFPNIPIVFCGINNYRDDLIAGIDKITGVAEKVDFSETINLIFKLHPETTHLVAISDGTISSNENLAQFRKDLLLIPEKATIVELTAMVPKDLSLALTKLAPSSVLFHLDYYAPPGNRHLTVRESFTFINKSCSLPIYANTDNKVGMGALGGVVITGALQGKTAARMAKDILSGKPVSEIPVQKSSPQRAIFDYRLLNHYNISASNLPENSLIINQPDSFYTRYKLPIIIVSGVILSLSIFSILLTINHIKQRESEKRYRDLFNEALDMIHIVDRDGIIIDANLMELKTLGYGKDEFIGKPLLEIIHPEHKEKISVTLRHLSEGRNIINFETILISRNGVQINVEMNAVPAMRDTKMISARAIIRNITERKGLENQLVQAQKMEALGTLAGGIAHDFNNILSPIIGYTEMALESIPAEDQVSLDMREVLNAANRAKELVKQILSFSRQANQELQPVKIQFVVKEALKLLRSSIPSTIEIKETIDINCGPIYADATQIHQIVMNLCTNAYHAMREKGGLLLVSLSPVLFHEEELTIKTDLKAGAYARLEVSDTGQGIDQNVIKKIFEPYFTTKGKEEGTGLGLSVVHGIVKSLKGEITVYSEPSQETTFRLYFPILVRETDDQKEQTSRDELPRGDERILLVDDDETIVGMYQQMLSTLGYGITAVTSSKEALIIFEKNPDDFDLVITDMTMPHMTGDKLAERIFSIRPDMPIILCTGFSELITKEKAAEIGIKSFIMKPCIKRDLANSVREILDNNEQDPTSRLS